MTNQEIDLLKLGLTYTPTPNCNSNELENDIFYFIRKLRLIYHFRNSDFQDKSLVKLPSTYTPPLNEHPVLEHICKNLEHTTITYKKSKDNIRHLREGLKLLTERIKRNEIIIKPADKGSITVIMNPDYYWDMCHTHLNNIQYYNNLGNENPSEHIQRKINTFADQYANILTQKEIEYLKSRKHKIANFYMLPKLHKSKDIDQIITQNPKEYIIVPTSIKIEGRPVVAGPAYHTSGISQMLHCILEPFLKTIPQILRDSFDFIERSHKQCTNDTLITTCDIKALYTNISHNLAYRAVEYWIDKIGNQIHTLQRFNKSFIMNGLKIILENNYFYINSYYFHQIKGTAMGTVAAVVVANLVVAFVEVRLFAMLPQIYPRDFVDYIIRNYFRFLDDITLKWLGTFDIKPFYQLINQLEPDLKFIFETPDNMANFLDVQIKVENNSLTFDIYYKPTNSFSYLHYTSCHPKHTKNNISFSLAKRIIQIVTINREERLNELKDHLVTQGHPLSIINYNYTKLFQPKLQPKNLEPITFVTTYNPNHRFNRHKFQNCLKHHQNKELKKAFTNKTPLLTTRQAPNLKNILTRAKFEININNHIIQREVGLFNCPYAKCKYHTMGYIKSCKELQFGKHKWSYNRKFTCDSKNVIYILICASCPSYYIGQTTNFRQRTAKHKSDIDNPQNSNCKECTNHLKECNKNSREPFFSIYPIYYEDDSNKRQFLELRFIKKFKPVLNLNHV